MPDASSPRPIPSLHNRVSEEEWRTRVDLAAAYRLVAREGWDEMLSTHLSAKVPGEDAYLLNPYGVLFGQMTASALVKVDYDGNVLSETGYRVNRAALNIHGSILKARDDVASAMHLHTVAGVAVSTHRDGLMPLNQRALYFMPVLAYHDYEGLALDADEGPVLVRDLSDNWAMILRNHGTLTVGRSVGQAFVYMFMLERACQIQVQTLSCGVPLTELPREVIEKVPQQATHWPKMGKLEWPALMAMLDAEDPSYRN